MVTALTWIGALVVTGYLIKVIGSAIRSSGLEEFTFRFKFKPNEKPPKQLNS